MTPAKRLIPTSGIYNFRDYGGYAAMGGARLKTGLLFRSGQHREATEDDLKAVVDLDIATIVDLRGNSERALYPCPRHPDLDARIWFVDGDTVNPATDDVAVDSADAARQRMRTSYADMPFRPLFQQALSQYFKALAETERPSLVHCLAGKDRTGLAVALFQSLLGVHPDDIKADFLLTNDAGRIEARIEAGAEIIRARFGKDIPIQAIRTLMSVHPSFLDSALNAIAERHGSAERYAESVLGVTPDIRVALAERYLD